jgi:sugar phosphate isomerase/epimerase
MHLRIGAGELDLKRIVQALKDSGYTGVWSLECFVANNNEDKLREELQAAKALFED